MASVDVVIMAAGKGTRMKSSLPKVLHRLAGRALLQHVVDTTAGLNARGIVIITGHGAQQVEAGVHVPEGTPAARFVRQEPQLGTGHAVQQAAPVLPDDGVTLVLNGDVPLIGVETLQSLLDACGGRQLALLTVQMPDPAGYGRIVREGEAVKAIVEHKDATPAQREITEIYTGVMAAPTAKLKAWLARLRNDNVQGEYYLTDVVKFAVADGEGVAAVVTPDRVQVEGVNSPVQLADLERAFQRRNAGLLMEQGVRLADPARIDVRGTLSCGADVEIDVNCIFEGRVSLGDGVRIGANCVVANASIAAGAVIHPFTHIDGEKAGAIVGEGALVGPFARLRPGAKLGREVHIGNFVEVKNSTLARGAKANHL
ncbi:MAG: bifunctional UDP-N-acetylglucosamine diphosphorylase/glucosamine-1-phosphate N-acetyltransferase GlmU, partial [Burkholderiaceae bacterium]